MAFTILVVPAETTLKSIFEPAFKLRPESAPVWAKFGDVRTRGPRALQVGPARATERAVGAQAAVAAARAAMAMAGGRNWIEWFWLQTVSGLREDWACLGFEAPNTRGGVTIIIIIIFFFFFFFSF
jgi:hypothetical protein